MIYYRFSLLDSKSKTVGLSPDTVFNTLYSESWFQDPWVIKLLEQVEQCKAQGRNMLSLVRSDVSYPAEDLGQGVKCLLSAKFVPEFRCNIDHIGENLYAYLDHFLGDVNLHLVGCLNPYNLASLYDTTFPPMYLEDFNKIISRSEEFQDYFYEWSRNNCPSPLTYRQLTNWNRRLDSPVYVNTQAKLTASQKQVYGAEFRLYFKMNFVQAGSSEGKTFLLKRMHAHNEIQQGFGKKVAYKTYMLHNIEHFLNLCSSGQMPLDQTYLILVDLDKFSQSIRAMDMLLDTPDNFVFLFVGRHVTTYIKVPLPSIYSCKLDKNACTFDIKQSCLINNSTDLVEYDTVVTEDAASGFMLFAPLAKDIRHALAAGGFGGLKSTLQDALRIWDSSRLLVVMDYATSAEIIPQLDEIDKSGKLVDIIVPTSSEYCLAFVSDSFDKFMHILQSYHSIRKDRLLEELHKFDKGSVTSETLDLLAFSQTFGFTNRREAKAADVVSRVVKYPEKITDLVIQEKESLRFSPDSLHPDIGVSEQKSSLFNKE